MTKIALEHKHNEVFKIFKRNSTPIDRMEQLADLDPYKVHDCIVDLMAVYNWAYEAYGNNDMLIPEEISNIIQVDA